jgi:hypothetical protein
MHFFNVLEKKMLPLPRRCRDEFLKNLLLPRHCRNEF